MKITRIKLNKIKCENHLKSVDKDGYCNYCGHQEVKT